MAGVRTKNRVVVRLGFAVAVAVLVTTVSPSFSEDVGRLVGEFHQCLEAEKKRGRNVTKAEELDQQSRLAMGQGKPDQAAKLLKEAISLLKGSPVEAQTLPAPPRGVGQTVTALPDAPADPVARTSPFGIFGPYQFVVDSREAMSFEKINGYLADLGVRWVQEMPMDLGSVPAAINVYSRVGREGGAMPPNVDYAKYLPALRDSLRRFRNRVKFWEVDTEPGGLPPPMGWKGYEKEYAVFLQKTHEVIKQECPDCQVVLGGAGGIANGSKEDLNAAFVRSILKLGAGASFDVFSFKMHHYKVSDYVDLKDKVALYTKLFADYGIALEKKQIFLETASYDGNPGYPADHPLGFIQLPAQTESQQAGGLVKTFVFAIAQGVDRVFWNEAFERHDFGGEKRNPFNFYGLVNNPLNDDRKSHKKLAYYAYKKMIEVLDGSDWQSVVKIREDRDACVYRFDRNGRSIVVAWSDRGAGAPIEIGGFRSASVRVSEAIPTAASGAEVVDYGTSFTGRVIAPVGQSIQVSLGEQPVYMEEIE